jgi:hypothetical protein
MKLYISSAAKGTTFFPQRPNDPVSLLGPERLCDAAIAVSTILTGQPDDRRRQRLLVVRDTVPPPLRRTGLPQEPTGLALRDTELLDLTTGIVAAHLSNNAVSADQLATLIQTVHTNLSGLGSEPVHEKLTPAVSIRKSVQKDAITCLECGQAGKMLN